MTAIDHHRTCPQPEPFHRTDWRGRPELYCPTCGRTALVEEDPVVRLVQPDPRAGLLAFVQLPGGPDEARVRIYRRGRAGWRWECDEHGANHRPACAHVAAVMSAIGLPLDQVDR